MNILTKHVCKDEILSIKMNTVAFFAIVLLFSINEKSDRTHLLEIILRFISCSLKGFLQIEMLFRAFTVKKVLLYYL